MAKKIIFCLVPGLALLSGCASDVVLKPAVNQFVTDSRAATTSVTQGYADLIEDTNTATAMMLAAHPECGFHTSILVRTPEMNRKLRSRAGRAAAARLAREQGTKPRLALNTYCLSDFETGVLSAAYANDPLRSTHLLVLGPSEFKPQLKTVQVLVDYVAQLAELADAPKLEAADRINGAAKDLRSVISDAVQIAGDFKALSPDKASAATALAADSGPIQTYATAVGNLANSLEGIAAQERDVKAIRTKLLDPKNQIREQILAIRAEADKWYAVHRAVRQSIVENSVAGAASELPRMTFDQRTQIFQKFLHDYSAEHASRSGSSPYGAMMVAIAEAHDDLQRIARGNYKPAEKRAMAAATLQRLGGVLKGIAGVAALFL